MLSEEQQHRLFDAIMSADFFDRPATLGTSPEPLRTMNLKCAMAVSAALSPGAR